MKFLQFYHIFNINEELDAKGNPIPTRDDIRKFNQKRNKYKTDYSKDDLNVALKALYSASAKISDEKLRNRFAEIIFRNMGSLEDLLKNIRKLNQTSLNNSEKENIEKILRRFENDLS